MTFNTLLFGITSWMRETTSYLSPIINAIFPPPYAADVEDQVLTNNQGLRPEDDFPVSSNNELASVQQGVGLPRRRKLYFYGFYSSFVILYLVLVFVTTCTYPIKPEYYIEVRLPVFEKESVNATAEMNESVYLTLWLNNRNELASLTYDDLNITMFYLDPRSNRSIYFASTIAPGVYLQDKKVHVNMLARGLPGVLQLQSTMETSVVFRVNLEFSARFDCKRLCKHKHRFLMFTDNEFSF